MNFTEPALPRTFRLTILKVDLYGAAVLLEEVGKVIAPGGVGVTISSQSGWRMPALTAEQDDSLSACQNPGAEMGRVRCGPR